MGPTSPSLIDGKRSRRGDSDSYFCLPENKRGVERCSYACLSSQVLKCVHYHSSLTHLETTYKTRSPNSLRRVSGFPSSLLRNGHLTEAYKDKPAKLLKHNPQNSKPKTQPQNPKPETSNLKQNHLVRLMACDSDRDYFTASKANFNAVRTQKIDYTSENYLNLSDS